MCVLLLARSVGNKVTGAVAGAAALLSTSSSPPRRRRTLSPSVRAVLLPLLPLLPLRCARPWLGRAICLLSAGACVAAGQARPG